MIELRRVETDEDVFEALPPEAVTVRVGEVFSRARYRLRDHREVRELLEELRDADSGGGSPS